jgi:A/G-specific adenine glycosylase
LKINKLDSVVVRKLTTWFARNARDLPWRRTRDPYAIWVSEIMLQQTQVKTVLPYWERWMTALPTVRALAGAGQGTVLKLWEGLGYYTRARNMQRASKIILAEYDGNFPERFDDVLALPGIGRYTAGAICSIAFSQPRPILDGNVIRVLTRVFGIAGDPRERTVNERLWSLAEQLVTRAAKYPGTLNQALMELGAIVCTAKNPRCEVCPLATQCIAFKTNRIHKFPQIAKRAPATARTFHAFVFNKRGRFLVRQRPAGVVNAHLWEFPNEEIQSSSRNGIGAAEPFCTIKHSITRYRMTLKAFKVTNAASFFANNGQWLPLTKLHTLPFASAHKRILQQLSSPRRKVATKLPG